MDEIHSAPDQDMGIEVASGLPGEYLHSWPDQEEGLEVIQGLPGGEILRRYTPPRITIEITGPADASSGSTSLGFHFAYREVYLLSFEDGYSGAEQGRDYDDTGIPALEANGNDAVPTGTIAQATLDESGTFWIFFHCCGG